MTTKPSSTREGSVKMEVSLSERDLYVIINALNYAKGEWATCDDAELTKVSDDADELEARLKSEVTK